MCSNCPTTDHFHVTAGCAALLQTCNFCGDVLRLDEVAVYDETSDEFCHADCLEMAAEDADGDAAA